MSDTIADTPVDPAPQADTAAADGERAFSQADVDRIVHDRLWRERQKFADYDDLKQKASRLDEIEEHSKTELQKALERAERAEQDRLALEQRAREAALRSAIVAEAAKPGRNVADPEAAVTFLTGPNADLLVVGDDGTPTNIADAMDALLANKPYLVAAPTRGSADQGARDHGGVTQLSEAELKAMTPEQIVQAKREGRLNALLGIN